MLKYVLNTYKPGPAAGRLPTTDEFQHQFLGLVTKKLPNGAANPAYDDVDLNGTPDGRVAQREAFIRDGLPGGRRDPDAGAATSRGGNPTTFVVVRPRLRAAVPRRSTPARPLVDLGLLSKPQTSNCRTATGETIGKAKACWAGGAAADLPQRRRPRSGQRRAGRAVQADRGGRGRRDGRQDQRGVQGRSSTPTTGPTTASPRAGRSSTAPSPRPRRATSRTAPARTADMAHPTRTGDLVVFAYPPYQFDAETPGTLIAPSHFFGQHGYVPDVQDLGATRQHAGDVPRRRPRHRARARSTRADDRPRADAGATARHPRAAAEPGPGADRACSRAATRSSRSRSSASTTSTVSSTRRRVIGGQRHQRPGRRRVAPGHDVRRGARRRCPARALHPGRRRQRRRLAAELRRCSRTCRRSTSRTRGGSTPRRYGNHEFDYGVDAPADPAGNGRTSRSWPRTSSTTATGKLPDWVKPSVVFKVNGVKVGVIGAELQSTPELVGAGATAGPHVPRRGPAHQGRVGAPQGAGRQRPGRRHPPGHGGRAQPDRQRRRHCRGPARSSASPTSSRTRRSTR